MQNTIDNKEYVVFWGLYQSTKFARVSDIPSDLCELLQPHHNFHYIDARVGKSVDDMKKTFRVHHWISSLPSWKEDIPPHENTYEINYAIVDEESQCNVEYPYL
jgi:hypothetical protein